VNRFWTLALPTVILAGCGLAEFEKRFEEQQKRIAEFDRENALLGDVLDLPGPKTSDDPKAPKDVRPWVYLRPPKGIQAKQPIVVADGLVYRFLKTDAAKGGPPLPPKPGGPDPEFLEMSVAVAKDKRPGDFQDALYKQLGYPKPTASEIKRKDIVDGQKKLSYLQHVKQVIGNAKASDYIHVLDGGDHPIAIIYRLPTDQADKLQAAMDASLRTLVLGDEAKKLRENFRSRETPPPGTPKS
jgi:hypothetical protein